MLSWINNCSQVKKKGMWLTGIHAKSWSLYKSQEKQTKQRRPAKHRTSRPEVFFEGVLQNLAKFKEKDLCWGLFFNNVAAILLKKRLQDSYFPVNFVKFLRTRFFYESSPVAASANIPRRSQNPR